MNGDKDPPWANINTIQSFDAGLECFDSSLLDSRDESISTLPDVNVSNLLILCLLEQLCQFIEKDATKAQRLKDVIVVQLQTLELIDVVSPSEDFKNMREEYKEYLFRLVTAAQQIVAQETKALVPKSADEEDVLDFGFPGFPSFPRSRYSSEFETVGYINKGGFGEVYKVKNKLDGQQYAIKKILVRSQDMLTKSIQKEVTVLASLHHPNIVKYHCAWLETIVPNLSSHSVTIVEHHESHFEEHFEFGYFRNNELPPIPNNREMSSGASFIQFKEETQLDSQSTLQEVKAVVPKLSAGDSQIFSGENLSESSEEFKSNKALVPANNLMTIDQSILYIQMELCGMTLREWMDKRQDHILSGSLLGSLQLRHSLVIFWQLVTALDYLHSNKIIHHDIKPGNIFVSGESGGIKLGDFGLACHYEHSKDISHHAIGTYTYAAPEQLEGGRCHFKSDIYSCGMILLELVMPPFKTNSERIEVLGKLRKDGSVPKIIRQEHPQWEKVICALTRHTPKKRPSAKDLTKTVMKMISELPSPEVVEAPKSLTDTCHQEFPENITYANSHNLSTSERCSKLVSTTNTIKSQMRSLQISQETYCGNQVEFGDNLLQLETADEVLRLKKENYTLREKVFFLEKELNFLREQIRLQGVQLSMK